MQERIFGDREKAMEEAYFRERDARLLASLRQKADLDEIALALRDKLHVDNPELLQRVRELGITGETATAFLLAPLAQVAWAEGKVDREEHDAIVRWAERRGMQAGTPAYAQLEEWLKVRPSDEFFDAALEVIRFGIAVMPPAERAERINELVQACQEVAETSGGVGHLLGLSSGVSRAKAASLEHIERVLRRH